MWSTKEDRERAEKEALLEGVNHAKIPAVPKGVDPRPKWMIKRDGPLSRGYFCRCSGKGCDRCSL